jgi:hypothetical protein
MFPVIAVEEKSHIKCKHFKSYSVTKLVSLSAFSSRRDLQIDHNYTPVLDHENFCEPEVGVLGCWNIG